ncbi:MAG: XDD3 family exosortase-dependent surface protein [Cyanobacteria bacterium P01_F01_bin.150]
MPDSTTPDLTPTITIDSPEDGIGSGIVGGTLYEIYGAATLKTENSLIFTIVSNISLNGNPANGAAGGVVAWGDMIINFGGATLHDPARELFGIKFVNNNESGAPEIGLYRDITIKSVVQENSGPTGGLEGYIDVVENAGRTTTFGDLGADPTPYFELTPYLENVIDDPGTRVADVQITRWTEADLPSLGIDIAEMVPGGSDHPLQVFSLAIPLDVLPGKPFTAHLAPECDNDILAIQETITPLPSITLEKLTNSHDADTLETAAMIAPGKAVTWSYHLSNNGNVAFNGDDISLIDDQDVVLTLDPNSDINNDGILSAGEQWSYFGGETAADLAFKVDFDTDAQDNRLVAGTMIDDEYQDIGITVSTPGHDHGAMLFDTANPTGGDHDLADPGTANAPLGHVLVLSEDGNSANPDDNAKGGIFRFDFDALTGINGVHMLDIDAQESIEIRTFDASNMVLNTYTFQGSGNNTFQTAELNSGWIAAIEIELTGSGAIAGLEGDRFYKNTATATITGFPDITVSDPSHYVNPSSHGMPNDSNMSSR